MKTRRTLWAAILLAVLGAWLPVASQTPATVLVRIDKRQGTAPSPFAETRAYNPAIPNMVSEVNTPAVICIAFTKHAALLTAV